MILVYKTRADKRDRIPAVNHVDDTGRLQTVERHVNPRYYRLIEEFERQTGVPIAAQHVVQRERADRDDARARGRDVPEDAHGRARARQPRRAPGVTRRAAAARPEPVLRAGRRGDRPAARAALQRPRARLRRDGRHGDGSPDAPAGRETRDGVDVVRVRSTTFERRRLSLRALNYATFLVQALRVALAQERPDVVLAMTDPPVIGDLALIVARRFRVPLVVVVAGRLPRDGGAARPDRQPRRARGAARARERVPAPRRPRRRDRRDDARAARREGRARGPRRR